MLKKLRLCCGRRSKGFIVPTRGTNFSKYVTFSERYEYVNDLQMRESGIANPMRDISHETMNPAYMSFQTAPSLLNRTNQTGSPANSEVYKNSDADSGMSDSGQSEPLNV